MTLSATDRVRAARARLSPYLSELLDRAAAEARSLHADEVTVEHLLCAALADEDSAASQVACHAFADPETIYEETLALAPGVLVVGSASTLAFSPRGVDALFAARRRAAAGGFGEVTEDDVLRAALDALDDGPRARLDDLGLRFVPDAARAPASPAVADDGALFASFSTVAKQALSNANRAASSLRARSISPAHLVLGTLAASEVLAARCGLTAARARVALHGDHEDRSEPPARELACDDALVGFLEALPEHAGTLELLTGMHGPRTPDLASLLARHKVTPELLQRSAAAFEDPR